MNPWVKPTTASVSKPIGPPGAATSKPAGRAVPTLVAGVNQEENQPLFSQEVARHEEADQILVAHLAETKAEEQYADTPPSCTRSLVLKLKINGLIVRALIDSAAETNLMSDRLNRQACIPRRPLVTPVEVKLAIEDNNSKSIFFKEFCFANVAAHDPAVCFGSTFFKLAPLGEKFDVILGTPFLKKIHSDVSLRDRTVTHVPTKTVLREEDAMEKSRREMHEA